MSTYIIVDLVSAIIAFSLAALFLFVRKKYLARQTPYCLINKDAETPSADSRTNPEIEKLIQAHSDQINQLMSDLEQMRKTIHKLLDFIRAAAEDRQWTGNLSKLIEEADRAAAP